MIYLIASPALPHTHTEMMTKGEEEQEEKEVRRGQRRGFCAELVNCRRRELRTNCGKSAWGC